MLSWDKGKATVKVGGAVVEVEVGVVVEVVVVGWSETDRALCD